MPWEPRFGATLLFAALTACNAASPVTAAPASTTAPVTVAIPAESAQASEPAPPPPSSASAPAASAPEPEASPPTCGGLPRSRPADMVFRFQRTIVPHGGPSRREGLEIHGAGTVCPATSGPRAEARLPCRQVPEATLDALFHEFQNRRFDAMRAVAQRRSPHYGTRTLEVMWGQHACEVSDSSTSGPPEARMKDFSALTDAVLGAKP